MREISIFSPDYSAVDPYALRKPQYMTATEIYDAIVEISGGEEESLKHDIVPPELWDRYYEETALSDGAITRDKYYYLDTAQNLLPQFDYGELYKIDLAIYKAGGWEYGGLDLCDILPELFIDDEALKLLNFKHYFIKAYDGIITDVKAKYPSILEAWHEELYDLNRFSFDALWSCLIKAMSDEGVCSPCEAPPITIKKAFQELFSLLNKKINSLDLSQQLGLAVTARQLILAYDRYITELQSTVDTHKELRRYYESKASKLKAEYEKKLLELEEKLLITGIKT